MYVERQRQFKDFQTQCCQVAGNAREEETEKPCFVNAFFVDLVPFGVYRSKTTVKHETHENRYANYEDDQKRKAA
jgi:hypothetical protein